MANINFLTGNTSSALLAKNTDGSYKITIVPGNVYFTTDGKIYFDTVSSERKCMSDSVTYANSAGSFSSGKTIALTGDVTGSATGGASGGWSITTTVADDSHDHTNFLKLDGSRTMTGILKTKASANSEGLATGALDLQNSNINHAHTIYFDAHSTPNVPGLYFYRDSTHVDGLYAKDGILYFSPNKEISNASYTSHIVLTSNNYNSYAPTKTGTGASGTWGISISGKAATAGSADKITTDAGSATLPVYFYGGVPVQCSSTLGVSITGNAATASAVAWSGITDKPSYYDANAIKTITRSGTTFTYTCLDGTTGTFTQQDTDTWRGIQDNLTSTSAVDSLSANQGKILNDKFANYLPLSGGTLTGNLTAPKVYGAVWNDYAEFREGEAVKPGYCVRSSDCGKVSMTNERLSACDGIVSDTFGFAIGETDDAKTPLAVAGRVLAYCEGERESYHAGDVVCASINGKVSKMTREEIKEWPDRIVGVVSEIPDYEIWGTGNVEVDGRIWIKVR